MYLEHYEKILKSSIHCVDFRNGNDNNSEIIGFRSGFIGIFNNRNYFITAMHNFDNKTNTIGLCTYEYIEDFKMKFWEISDLSFFKVTFVKDDMNGDELYNQITNDDNFREIDLIFKEVGDLNLSFDGIDTPILNIDKSPINIVDLNDISILSDKLIFGFSGNTLPEKRGLMTFQIKNITSPITFHKKINDYIIFKTNRNCIDKSEYEGTSGAPILDEEGKFAGMMIACFENSYNIMGLDPNKIVGFIKVIQEIEELEENKK